MNRLYQSAAIVIVLTAVVLCLVMAQDILIPLVLAFFSWIIVRELVKLLDRINALKNWLPYWTKVLFVAAVFFTLLALSGTILSSNIQVLASSYEQYSGNMKSFGHEIDDLLGLNIMELLSTHSSEIDFGQILSSLIESLSSLIGNAFLVVIFAIFLFLEERTFDFKLRALVTDEDKRIRTIELIAEIELSIRNYLGIKTLTSLSTAILAYIILLLSGIQAPVFWAFVILLLNYIPSIGSIIATIFPFLFAILQFGNAEVALILLFGLGFVQLTIGNFIEPKLMGNSLNISPLVVLLSLSVWGMIWGITGMLLSVPITVIILIICSHFPATRQIAIMLSEKGKINND